MRAYAGVLSTTTVPYSYNPSEVAVPDGFDALAVD